MSETEIIPLNREDYEAAAVAERARFMPLMRIDQALERRTVVVEAFNQLMVPDQDYGVIKGTKQPTLLQPGAQKLDNLFGLVPRFPTDLMRVEEDWTGEKHGGEPFFRYLVVCQLMRGEFVAGEAVGECNSWESKYRYRTAERKCPDCGQSSILQTRHKDGPTKGEPKNFWCAPFRGGCGHGFKLDDPRLTGQETGRKPNPEIFDQVNTMLKMAQKRAHVAATINATSASEFFTQDLEDVRGEPDSAAVAGDRGDATEAPVMRDSNSAVRPVPDELKAVFSNIDRNSKHIAEAFKMMEAELQNVGGANGIIEYNRVIKKLRYTYPKGSEIPKDAIKDCLIDLFEASRSVGHPGDFMASDSDLPDELKETK